MKKISPGTGEILGATPRHEGVNFALFSAHAEKVFLLLFDSPDSGATDIIQIEDQTRDHTHHVFVHGIGPGQLYGYKIEGPYNPAMGLRYNDCKLLIDPYAKAVSGKTANIDNLLFGYDSNAPEMDIVMDRRDNTPFAPKSIVIDDLFEWGNVEKPGIPMEDLIIYEVHLRGFTAHPASGVQFPGTYLGFIEKIPYLKQLGVNAVELLPIQEFHTRDKLVKNGLAEYWGYNTIGFFSPESSYSTRASPGCQVQEFKSLVRELHREGIELILDVVYNHTGEVDELGPTLCFRGIDNTSYYLLKGPPHQPGRFYIDETGCKNTLNVEHPAVVRMVIDSLRYWAEIMHVDGFRFDLAPVLAKKEASFSTEAPLFNAISEDPVLSKVKLIAEPWDLAHNQAGNFPPGWSEWNGMFRDTTRKFLMGEKGQIRELGWRLTGSQDLFDKNGRRPFNSVNFITCHDGFTLHDLFSYDEKHNRANREDNKDGTELNFSSNSGAEGDTKDEKILCLRKRLIKNAVFLLFFSMGTPMMLGGDEFMRTQRGNNNAYCQDNELNWSDWDQIDMNSGIHRFFMSAIEFRKTHGVLKKENFLGPSDITWFDDKQGPPEWSNSEGRILCYQIPVPGKSTSKPRAYLFFILNAGSSAKNVPLPQHSDKSWYRTVDTSRRDGEDFLPSGEEVVLEISTHYPINPRTFALLVAK
jgi:glycogen operon protein